MVAMKAPLPGTIVQVLVKEGQKVDKNEAVLVIEAMKMENDIVAPEAGTVKAIHVAQGDSVPVDALLVEIE